MKGICSTSVGSWITVNLGHRGFGGYRFDIPMMVESHGSGGLEISLILMITIHTYIYIMSKICANQAAKNDVF